MTYCRHCSDERKSLQAGAPLVHEGGNRVKPPDRYKRGDVDKGFAEADVVLEQSYRTECEIHTPLERHGCVAEWSRDRLTVWPSTQGVYRIQSQLSAILGLPLSKVRVIGHYMGGGFGSKLAADKETVIAALLAKKTGRPVKLFMTREETYIAAGNRPPANMRLKAGVKKDGTLTALDFSCVATGGAYPPGDRAGSTGRSRTSISVPSPDGAHRCPYQRLPVPRLPCARAIRRGHGRWSR